MLYQFTFSNYKSFKDEATLDLIPKAISEHKDTLIKNAEDDGFLPMAVLYGPNGGGKSTVLESLRYLETIIIKPIIALNADLEEETKARIDTTKLKDKYYKFDKSYEFEPTSFEVFFCVDKIDFKYQLSIIKNEIVEENLYMRKLVEDDVQIVFERNRTDMYLGEVLKGVMADKIKNTMPLLSYLSMYKINVIDSVIKWFANLEYIDYDKPMVDKKVLILANSKSQKLLFDMLREIDIRISGIRAEEDTNGNITHLYTQHMTEDGTIVELPFEEESSGTRKLFSLLQRLLNALRKGSLVIADEMDAKLHPKLLRYVIELFTNSKINAHGAQLLFTSHDLTTMIPEVFRRDEIWFCALNAENSSIMYSLADFRKENGNKTRNDEIYGKRYLEGRYGADPYFRRIVDWEDISK